MGCQSASRVPASHDTDTYSSSTCNSISFILFAAVLKCDVANSREVTFGVGPVVPPAPLLLLRDALITIYPSKTHPITLRHGLIASPTSQVDYLEEDATCEMTPRSQAFGGPPSKLCIWPATLHTGMPRHHFTYLRVRFTSYHQPTSVKMNEAGDVLLDSDGS